jgi:regulator of sirC expression with transglutaminase-like and TPR domain
MDLKVDLDAIVPTDVIGVDPNYALAYYGRGVAYSQQGSHPQVIADLERFLELSLVTNDLELISDSNLRLQAEQHL